MGSTKAGTLSLDERTNGIHFEISPPDNTTGRDAVETLRRGDVDGVSFGFIVREDLIEKVDGEIVRTVTKGDLIEVSPVSFPAYSQTQIGTELCSRIDALQNAEESDPGDEEETEPQTRQTHSLETLLLELDLLEMEVAA